ncbi:MaoC/PaaZ C-terminal domain-containing protein [Marinobacterium sedimentorum]|uniref:bifunctional OB-fold nucleic acid binding domain-containing protein/MaoC family dehydratase n=1 Tax=Marinobacterium sedimentorum TaxID=2927804 RepID=UPI0020C5B764|nr:OB-fold domain-containing protein [Marinobacterium sedimentorum]MCP8689521.1 OB-fold domain-containing protein [Marinobacterium sedimentorum]
MASLKPMPVMTEISRPFWQGLNDGEIRIQQCNQCEGWVFFPRRHCSHCLAHDLAWRKVDGRGTLYSYTLTRIPTLPEFADEMPQALAVVELEQGVRINSTLVGLDEDEIRVGMAVKAVLDRVDARGNTLLRFTGADKALESLPYVDPLAELPRNDKGQVQVPVTNPAALQALVSDEFTGWSAPIEVNQALIDAFAELSGDDYWIHTDPERAAKESPFGSTIAHGSLVQVLQSRLNFALPFDITGFSTMVNYGSDRLRFPAPVPAGSRIHARARVKSVQQSRKGTVLTLEVNIHVLGSERPSVINDLVILYR